MRLVRGGRIVADQYVRVLDDAPIPDGVPVIVPAARFLADAEEILRREAPTGVLWPNNRRIAELAPHLDRLALVALELPSSRMARLQPGARALRAVWLSRRIACHRQCARPVPFPARGFDPFEVVKDADARSSPRRSRASVVYQPTGDRRILALRARLQRPQTFAACERV
jgi:uncharacterized protein (DUF934 family)